jgi:chromate transporter
MELAQKNINITTGGKITLSYLFYTFFKIGCVSFGGYMALVSLVQKIMVDKDETVDNNVIIDSITVASLIPGPVAVNIVAYIGYHLKGKTGAAISMIAVLLPACTLMLFLAWTYYTYAYKIEWAGIMHFAVATVSAVILSTGFNLYKKEIARNYGKGFLCLITVLITTLTSSYLITLAAIFIGAVCGILLAGEKGLLKVTGHKIRVSTNPGYLMLSGLVIVNEFLFITNAFKNYGNALVKITIAFAGISLSLFGGGYIMVPLMQSLFVNNLHWLSAREFVDAIAFSQATPGPILVSATFIGYKLAGVIGAFVATIAMFAPSAILMIVVSRLFRKTKDHRLIRNMISGVKVVVIGLILGSAARMLYQQSFSFGAAVVAVAALILSFKYKVSPVFLIIGSISIGILTKYL